MDNENFEQVTVEREMIGEPADFLVEAWSASFSSMKASRSAWNCRKA